MEQKHPKRKRILIALLALTIVVFCSAGYMLFQKDNEKNIKEIVEAAEPPEADAVNQEDLDIEDTESYTEKEVVLDSNASEEKKQEALTSEIVSISDVYAEKDSIVIFQSFYPDAISYSWEVYDMAIKDWKDVPTEDVTSGLDELFREVSSFWTTAIPENHEMMVRCTIDLENKETITDVATLYVLDKHIESLTAEDFHTDCGKYVSIRETPVEVTYTDGTSEILTGLNGLYFLQSEESSEFSTTISGNAVETVTTVNTSCEYTFLDIEEKETILRYQNGDFIEDVPMKLIGEDLSAPEITSCEIREFEISNIDKPVPVTVSIMAADNNTPYPHLEYAFLPEGKEPQDTDWIEKASFDVEITQNGTWIAYCRDKSGNMATAEKDIIAVDNKAPIISLQLLNGVWCKSNTIIVDVTDGLSVEYSFSCAQTGEDSGWITRNEYEVKENSTWKIKVRDAAGNVTEQEIEISNIDNQMPVIQGITEKKENNYYENQNIE